MKIALVGLHNDKNLGDPIITESFEYLYSLFRSEDTFERIEIDGFNVINSFLYRIIMKLERNYNVGPNIIYKWQAYRYYKKKLRSVDLVVFTGGGIIKFKGQYFYGVEAALKVAEEFNIPVAFNSVGVEGYDYKDSKCRSLVGALKNRSLMYISTRDDIDMIKMHYIKQKILVEKVADPAVWIAERYKLIKKSESNIIGIGVADYSLFTRYKTSISQEYIKTFYVETASLLIQKGYKLEIFTNGLSSDNVCAIDVQRCLQTLGFEVDVRIPCKCEELVKIISEYKGIIATRMHSCIVAYSLDVPAIGLVWNNKLNFFGQNIGASDNYISDQFVIPNLAIERLEKAISIGYDSKTKEKFRNSIYEGVRNISKLIDKE